MAIPCYLAMTDAEVSSAPVLPAQMAWMACHFSCYSVGLSNLPSKIPEGSMIILNDCIPICNHDPMYMLEQLQGLYETLRPDSFLLDFQRTDVPESACLAAILTKRLPCPVGVTEGYAKELDCPVFLTAPPPHKALAEHIAPWQGREIWLELAVEGQIITVTRDNARTEFTLDTSLAEPCFTDEKLHCNYHITLQEDAAVFHLARQTEHIPGLLKEGEKLGVCRAVGLYQQLKEMRERN